jgi:hypothetical protein
MEKFIELSNNFVFENINKNLSSTVIDLHGLNQYNALQFIKKRILELKKSKINFLNVITGFIFIFYFLFFIFYFF